MDIKKVLVILIIIILLLMIFMGVIVLKLNNNYDQENLNNEEELFDSGNATLKAETTAERVNNSNRMFWTISECINNTFNLDYNVYVWDLYSIDKISTETYFAYIITNKKESRYIAVNIDHDSSAYSIEQISNSDYENIVLGTVPQKYLEDIEVEKNGNNSIIYASLSSEEISKHYMEMINDLLINYPEILYERLADDYKQAKFNTYEKFEKYCTDRADFIREKEYMSYATGVSNGNRIYKAKDTNQNIYIIEELSSRGFNIYLDDYTIDTDEFKKSYDEAADTLKASTNVDKFIKMINNQDYSSAYSLLNQSYKNANFPTESSYREYLVNEFYPTNIIKSTKVEKQGNYYIVTVDISEGARASALSQQKQIIISLGKNTEFEMSIGY